MVHVSDVSSGLRCGCFCVVCRNTLVAKKGSANRHHFAHAHAIKCEGAAETALHLLSKELLAALPSFSVPGYNFAIKRETAFGRSIELERTVAKGGLVKITSVRIENSEPGFVPDILIQSGERSMIVEIAVTHRVERRKLRRIRSRGVAAIEIQLDPSDALLDRESLAEKLQHDLQSKVWLFHPGQRDVERDFFRQYRLVRAQERAAKRMPSLQKIWQHSSPKSVVSVQNIDGRSLQECDRQIFLFMQKHGRNPTTEECLKLWPQFWAPPA